MKAAGYRKTDTPAQTDRICPKYSSPHHFFRSKSPLFLIITNVLIVIHPAIFWITKPVKPIQPIPACIGWEAGYILDSSPVSHSADTHTDRHLQAIYSFQLTRPAHVVDCGRKPERPEETQTGKHASFIQKSQPCCCCAGALLDAITYQVRLGIRHRASIFLQYQPKCVFRNVYGKLLDIESLVSQRFPDLNHNFARFRLYLSGKVQLSRCFWCQVFQVSY